MVFGMELTYNEVENILDIKYIDAWTVEYTSPVVIYKINDSNPM